MLSHLKKLLVASDKPVRGGAIIDKEVAAAALLIEVSRGDSDSHADELAVVRDYLREVLGLPADRVVQVMAQAGDEVTAAGDLYRFTDPLNRHFTVADKLTLVQWMWRVAYVHDGLDRHEEYLVRRVAELIGIEHRDFINAKHRERERVA